MDRRTVTARLLRYGLLAFLYYATSAFVLNTFMEQWEFLTDEGHNGFVSMMNHTAYRPWAYRVLTPAVVNACATLVPGSFIRAHGAFLSRDSPVLKYMRAKNPPGWNAEMGLRYHIAYYLVFLVLVATFWLTRWLAMLHLRRDDLLTDVTPVVAAVVLPLTFLVGGYVYDFPEMFFCLAALLCLEKRWYVGFYLVLPLAILNKESNVLLVLYFGAFLYDAMPKPRLVAHLAAQAIMGVALLVAVRHALAGAPGVPAVYNLPGNLAYYSHPMWLVRLAQPYASGIPFPRAFNVINLAVLGLVLFYRWGEKPLASRRLFVVVLVVLFPLYAINGYHDEVRNLSLVFPAIFLLALHTFADVFDGLQRRPAEAR